MDRLRGELPSGEFRYQLLCLDDLSSVRDFNKRMCDEGRPIDVLLNNAGVMACPEMKTKDGFEYQLGVNHLGHFVLTSGLLPLMSDSERCVLADPVIRRRCITHFLTVARNA